MGWNGYPTIGTPIDPAHPFNRGVVADYPLWEGAGNAVRSINGTTNVGAFSSPPPAWQGNRTGASSLKFNGSSNQVTVGVLFPAAPVGYSLAAWVTPRNVGAFTLYFGFPSTVYLAFNGGAFAFQGGTFLSVGTAVNGTEYFVVGTDDGVTTRLYVDGIQIGSGSGSLAAIAGTTGYLGAYGGSFWCQCELRDCRAYNRVLSPQEIQAQFRAPYSRFLTPGVRKWYVAAGGGGGTTNARLVNAGLLRGGMLIGGRLAA